MISISAHISALRKNLAIEETKEKREGGAQTNERNKRKSKEMKIIELSKITRTSEDKKTEYENKRNGKTKNTQRQGLQEIKSNESD